MWGDRWDRYFFPSIESVHWRSIATSLAILLLISTVAAVVLLRALNRDISLYNIQEELVAPFFNLQEETLFSGWKMLHADAFRPPRFSSFFAALVGTGIQILGMSAVLLGI